MSHRGTEKLFNLIQSLSKLPTKSLVTYQLTVSLMAKEGTNLVAASSHFLGLMKGPRNGQRNCSVQSPCYMHVGPTSD